MALENLHGFFMTVCEWVKRAEQEPAPSPKPQPRTYARKRTAGRKRDPR